MGTEVLTLGKSGEGVRVILQVQLLLEVKTAYSYRKNT
jgi:hypothetical protein